jgi:hypothetical protein
MKLLIPLIALLAAAPQAPALAQSKAKANSQPRVTQLLRDHISLYDASGQLIRKAPKNEVTTPLPVLHVNQATGQPAVTWKGATVYLRNSEILTENLAGPCAEVGSAARPSSRAIAASEGVGAGLGTTGQRCVQAR